MADKVREVTANNTWVKADLHASHIADFLGHLVAASYASPKMIDKMPPGYDFLPPYEFPHPIGKNRGRTALAGEVVAAMGDQTQHQLFGLIVWRFHNTKAAFTKFHPLLERFRDNEDLNMLREGMREVYDESRAKTYLFSTCDGRRGTGKKSYREAVLTNLGSWWESAKHAARILQDPATTSTTWHDAFLKEVVPRLPCWGYDYWPKFLYGDIGHHIAKDNIDLDSCTMVGIGCRSLLKKWGIHLPKTGFASQRQGLEAVREIRRIVAAVVASGLHAGIEAARREAGLVILTSYDVQVQSCECKRGFSLPPRIAAARTLLWTSTVEKPKRSPIGRGDTAKKQRHM